VAGPSTFNFADAYDVLVASGGAMRVTEAPNLAPVLGELIGSAGRLATMREAANAALRQLSGALDRTAGALLPYLADAGGERAPRGTG